MFLLTARSVDCQARGHRDQVHGGRDVTGALRRSVAAAGKCLWRWVGLTIMIETVAGRADTLAAACNLVQRSHNN
jgi:hypothetical protein